MSARDSNPRRVLIRSVNWLGDVVMTLPAIERIRAGWPDASFSVLAPSKLADLWRMQSFVDEVIETDKKESVLSLGRRLRALKFDAAVVLPNSPRTALEVWLAGIPLRAGYGGGVRSLFLTGAIPRRTDVVTMRKRTEGEIRALVAEQNSAPRDPVPVESHHVSHYLHLAKALGFDDALSAPKLEVTPDALAAFQDKFLSPEQREWIVKGSPLIGINPGADYGPAKRWPTPRFVETAAMVNERTPAVVAVFGGPGDEVGLEVVARLNEQIGAERVVKLVGETSLGELLAGLKSCKVMVSNDSGPMHVAAALGTPIVGIFGSTSMELTGPGMPGKMPEGLLQEPVPCSPCFLRACPIDFRCMNSLQVERVVEAVMKEL
ncbi:lipopolysaccharide heptosyltransferase II [Verrucomicrobia bacterium]|nr:lipopolysaccharide heptosyltransferase II [Verrucomicrobiota bacterium]